MAFTGPNTAIGVDIMTQAYWEVTATVSKQVIKWQGTQPARTQSHLYSTSLAKAMPKATGRRNWQYSQS
jgi:hypothetical protein